MQGTEPVQSFEYCRKWAAGFLGLELQEVAAVTEDGQIVV